MIQRLETSLLTPEARSQFEEDGYCVVDGLYTEAELREIEEFFEEYRKSPANVFDGSRRYEEIDPTQSQVRAMHPHRYSGKVMGWFTNPKLAAVLEELFGKPPLGAQTMYYYKPPGARGQGMHQDDMYLLTTPANCMAAWTPIDDTDEENGCLRVVPGSHRLEVMCPDPSEEKMTRTESWTELSNASPEKKKRVGRAVPVPLKRGQTMFFGGRLIHGSGPNKTTDRSRRVFIGHYVDESTEMTSKFYHPVVNMRGEVVSRIQVNESGGPCADGWEGKVH